MRQLRELHRYLVNANLGRYLCFGLISLFMIACEGKYLMRGKCANGENQDDITKCERPVAISPTPTPTIASVAGGDKNTITSSDKNINAADSASVYASPTMTILTPSGSVIRPQNGNYAITWNASDSNGFNPNISLYYKTSNSGSCNTGTLITSSLTMNGAAGNYNWTTNTITAGTYYICGIIDNGQASAITAWSPGTIQVNNIPTFSFSEPMGTNDFVKAGSSFSFTWTDSDSDDDAQISFYYGTTASGACTSGTLITSGISEDSATNSYSWTPSAALGSNAYFICARINDGVNPLVDNWSARLIVFHECLWNTAGTTTWSTTTNWTGCNSVQPTQYDMVVVPSGGTQPRVTGTDANAAGFGSFATGGGTVTVDSGRNLSVSGTNQGSYFARSDISFTGSTTPCSTCIVNTGNSVYVGNDSKIRLLTGIVFQVVVHLYFGDGVSSGHLATGVADANPNNWPIIDSIYSAIFTGISGNLSSIDVDGLTWNGNANSNIALSDYYRLQKLDNLTFNAAIRYAPLIGINNCNNADFVDTTWSNLQMNAVGGINLDAFNCTSPAITVSGGGIGYGKRMSRDPNNLITWVGGGTYNTCTWTGATNTSWTTTTNWSGCANGRSSFPDGNDTVIIPTTGNQPVLTTNAGVYGFAAGTGGGTITINAGVNFSFSTDTPTVASSIGFLGGTASCTTCLINAGYSNVANATLTLGPGVTVGVYSVLTAGNSGTISVNGGGTPSHWPVLGFYVGVKCQGSAGNPGVFSIDGLSITVDNTYIPVEIGSYCDVQKFDNVTYSLGYAATSPNGRVRLSDCTGSVFTDTSWTNWLFSFPGYNTGGMIAYSNANCNTSGPINIFPNGGGGAGYLPATAQDLGNIFIWN